jgi:hypothetical protein
MKQLLMVLVCMCGLSAVFETAAYAYLDPGTGSYIFQMLIAAFCTGLFFIKNIVSWFKGLFSKKNEHADKEN